MEKILGALGTPITFYGKVIDQKGEPVPGANIDYGTIDKFDADGSNYQGKSDADGYFYITNIKGAVLTVGVSKTGYYNIHGKSDMAFAYGVGPDSSRRSPPTKESPAIFELRKMGHSEKLIRSESGQIDVPITGEPIAVDIKTGKRANGDFQIESWIGDRSHHPFPWRYRFSVAGGGIVERQGQFDFDAPSDGYQSSIELNMPESADQWASHVNRNYFVQLPDGRYARVTINLYVGVRNFVRMESFVNPNPGDHNLEYDPTNPAPAP